MSFWNRPETSPSLQSLFHRLGTSEIVESDLELSRLLSRIRTPDGFWKTTHPGRHTAVNEFLTECLSHHGLKVTSVADVGISSGITTVELLEHLEATGSKISRVVAVDRCFEAAIVRLGPRFYALIASDNSILRLEVGPLNFLPWISGWDIMTGAAIVKKAATYHARHRLGQNYPSGAFSHSCRDPDSVRRMKLISPSLSRRNDVLILERDLLDALDPTLEGQVDLVRAASFLSPELLSEADIRTIVTNLRFLSREGGLLYVCRDRNNSPKASLFRFGPSRLQLVASMGGGVDVEGILVALDLGH